MKPFIFDTSTTMNLRSRYYCSILYIRKEDLNKLLKENPKEYKQLQIYREENRINFDRISYTG